MKKMTTKSEALEAAKESSRNGNCRVTWWRYSTNEYLATTLSEYIETASLADEQIAGFENGAQTF